MERKNIFEKLALIAEESVERYAVAHISDDGDYTFETEISEILEKDKYGRVTNSNKYGIVKFQVSVGLKDDEFTFTYLQVKADVYDKFGRVMQNISKEVNKRISI